MTNNFLSFAVGIILALLVVIYADKAEYDCLEGQALRGHFDHDWKGFTNWE